MLKKIIIGGLSFLGILFILSTAIIIYGIKTDYKYTGEELYKAINGYRQSKGLDLIELDLKLCNNIVERWANVKEGKRHQGSEEWAKKTGIADDPKYKEAFELFVTESTPQRAITAWQGSPSHRLILEKEDIKYGCVYAAEGTGIAILASPRK